MQAILSLSPSPADTAFAVLQVSTRAHGKTQQVWNPKFRYFEHEQPTRAYFRCIDVWTVAAQETVARLASSLASGKQLRIANEPVSFQVVIDRADIGDALVNEIWKACTHHGAGCVVVDVRTDKRDQPHGPQIVSLKGGDAGVDDGVAARDVSECLREARRTKRLEISAKSAEYAQTVEELDRFDWQPDRRRARALALGLYSGFMSASAPVGAGTEFGEMSEAEAASLAAAVRRAEMDAGEGEDE